MSSIHLLAALLASVSILAVTPAAAQDPGTDPSEGSGQEGPVEGPVADGPVEEGPLGDDQGSEEGPTEEGPVSDDDGEEESELEGSDDLDDSMFRLEPITVTPEQLGNLGGSGHIVDEKALEEMEHDDPHAVFTEPPGVYVRQEDGYGLRPNIGLRGANSDRSKKVTLMEDGVLLGPAPYSAPAAYYFPIITRMTAVEIYKGPAAIKYGPNTIGGAIDMTTREVPYKARGAADFAYGSDNYAKLHLHHGVGGDYTGVLVEGVHIRSDGFKELDVTDGDTGFDKSELMLKARLNSDPANAVFHRLRLKAGLALEDSRETYLGLTDDDFADNPFRRYAASELALMEWWRTQLVLAYDYELGNDLNLTVAAYRHDFHRSWRKLNRFRGGPGLEEILADPDGGRRAIFYRVLTGTEDTSGDADTLQIGTNDRRFVSQGIQLTGVHRFEREVWANVFEFGARLHADQIERLHTEEGYAMTSGRLVRDATPEVVTTDNTGRALAVAVYALDELTVGAVTVAPGLRLEVIGTELENTPTSETTKNSHTVLIPGISFHYAFTEHFGALAGVHRGFSPVAPGQPGDVEPEFAINYEAGVRYLHPDSDTHLELIGFFNDYDNLTGECTFSAGCANEDLDQQFNAGEVDVIGLESVAGRRFRAGPVTFPIRASYTLTMSEFQTAFASDNPQFGDVEEGDELPYVPMHQASLRLGAEVYDLSLVTMTTFVDEMLEEAGQKGDVLKTDRQLIVDAVLSWKPLAFARFYLKVDNVMEATPIVSRRPFGARPNKPRLVFAGAKFKW